MPEIQAEIDALLARYNKDLLGLPKAMHNTGFEELVLLLYRFAEDFSRHLDGIPREDGLLQMIRPQHQQFRSDIMNTAPDFIALESPIEVGPGPLVGRPKIYIDEVLKQANMLVAHHITLNWQ